MSNYHYIKSGSVGKIYVLDIESLEYKLLDEGQVKQLGDLGIFDSKNLKYKGESLKVRHSKGTIVYKDGSLDAYIVANIHKGIIKLTYRQNIGFQDNKNKFCNSSMLDVIDIHQVLDKINASGVKVSYYLESNTMVKQDKFKAYIGKLCTKEESETPQSEEPIEDKQPITEDKQPITEKKQTENQSEQPPVEDKPVEQQTETPSTQSQQEIKEQLNSIIIRENRLKRKIEQLKEKEKEIKKSEDKVVQELAEVDALKEKLVSLISKLQRIDEPEIKEVIVEANNIFNFKETINKPKDKRVVFPNYTYELILKSLSCGDIISIPSDYISGLNTTKIKYLEASPGNTGDTVLEKVKFNKYAEESLVVITGYSNHSECARIFICMDFGINSITDKDIVNYELLYISIRDQLKQEDN